MSIKNVKMDYFDDVFPLFFWKQIGINNNYFATPFISCLALRYIMKWNFTVIETLLTSIFINFLSNDQLFQLHLTFFNF